MRAIYLTLLALPLFVACEKHPESDPAPPASNGPYNLFQHFPGQFVGRYRCKVFYRSSPALGTTTYFPLPDDFVTVTADGPRLDWSGTKLNYEPYSTDPALPRFNCYLFASYDNSTQPWKIHYVSFYTRGDSALFENVTPLGHGSTSIVYHGVRVP